MACYTYGYVVCLSFEHWCIAPLRDIYRERTVHGISFIFVAIDALGDLTSLISALFEPKLSILGLIIYVMAW